jgi:hypothetical protein
MKSYGLEIVITDWALDSYLHLLHSRVFTKEDYRNVLRPGVMKLKSYPSDVAFSNDKFWGPAEVMGNGIAGGFKMKWRQVGSGRAQLRLPVAILGRQAYLCRAYVKANAARRTKSSSASSSTSD